MICFSLTLPFLKVIHNLSMWSAKDKNLTYDQLKEDAAKAKKDLKLVRVSNNIYDAKMYQQ